MTKRKNREKNTSPESEPRKKKWKRPHYLKTFGKGKNWHKIVAKRLLKIQEKNEKLRKYEIGTSFLDFF